MTAASPQAIVLVITQLDPGGAERTFTNLALHLNGSKFKPTVISLRARPTGSQTLLVEKLEAAGIPVEFLNCRAKWQFPFAVLRLARRLRAIRPALVQSFLFHANVVAALAGKLAAARVVAGVRVADPSRNRQRVEGWLSPLINHYVCVSQSVADFCQQQCGIRREKLIAIPNGVDVSRFEQAVPADLATLGIPASRRLLISIGRLDKQKGHAWLLPILSRVFGELPDHDLLLVGDGPQREALQKQAADLGIASRVHFLGWRADVPQLLKAAKLLLLPSRWEGMPNVLLEAMAAGLPVLTTQVEGAQEILGPLQAQQLVSWDDANAFEKQLLALSREADLLALAQANHARVASTFSLQVVMLAYEQLYARLMNS